MKHLLAALTCAIVLNACQEVTHQTTPIDAEIILNAPVMHSGPFWAAFMVYSNDTDEVRYGIGPFLSPDACRERLIAELLQIKDDGGTPSFGECVASNELGEPLEAVVIPQGRGI